MSRWLCGLVTLALLASVHAEVDWSNPGADTQFDFPAINYPDRTFLTGTGEGPATGALSTYHPDIRNTYVSKRCYAPSLSIDVEGGFRFQDTANISATGFTYAVSVHMGYNCVSRPMGTVRMRANLVSTNCSNSTTYGLVCYHQWTLQSLALEVLNPLLFDKFVDYFSISSSNCPGYSNTADKRNAFADIAIRGCSTFIQNNTLCPTRHGFLSYDYSAKTLNFTDFFSYSDFNEGCCGANGRLCTNLTTTTIKQSANAYLGVSDARIPAIFSQGSNPMVWITTDPNTCAGAKPTCTGDLTGTNVCPKVAPDNTIYVCVWATTALQDTGLTLLVGGRKVDGYTRVQNFTGAYEVWQASLYVNSNTTFITGQLIEVRVTQLVSSAGLQSSDDNIFTTNTRFDASVPECDIRAESNWRDTTLSAETTSVQLARPGVDKITFYADCYVDMAEPPKIAVFGLNVTMDAVTSVVGRYTKADILVPENTPAGSFDLTIGYYRTSAGLGYGPRKFWSDMRKGQTVFILPKVGSGLTSLKMTALTPAASKGVQLDICTRADSSALVCMWFKVGAPDLPVKVSNNLPTTSVFCAANTRTGNTVTECEAKTDPPYKLYFDAKKGIFDPLGNQVIIPSDIALNFAFGTVTTFYGVCNTTNANDVNGVYSKCNAGDNQYAITFTLSDKLCFPGVAEVQVAAKDNEQLPARTVKMVDVRAGDRVATLDADGQRVFTTVVYVQNHEAQMGNAVGYHLIYYTTAKDVKGVLRITDHHYLYLADGTPATANQIVAGSLLRVLDQDGQSGVGMVTRIEHQNDKTAHVIITESGDLLVDGVLASSYAESGPRAGHVLYGVHRFLYKWAPSLLATDAFHTAQEHAQTAMRYSYYTAWPAVTSAVSSAWQAVKAPFASA